MGTIILHLDADIQSLIKKMANDQNVEPSQWLSEFVTQQVKQHQGWSDEVKSLAGSWKDFPSLNEIRDTDGIDSKREEL